MTEKKIAGYLNLLTKRWKLFIYFDICDSIAKYHSTNGPLTATDILYSTELFDAVSRTAVSMGFPVRDFNGEFSSGTCVYLYCDVQYSNFSNPNKYNIFRVTYLLFLIQKWFTLFYN